MCADRRNRIILRILALHVTIHGEGRRERREKPRKSRKSKRCAGKRDNNSYEVNILKKGYRII